MSDNENSAYEKLTPARKALVDAVMKNLENGVGLWEQGWAGGGAPVSGISGKQYNGINRMFLMAATAERGYSDNRWVTFKQMEDKGWSFKRDEEGRSRGKNAGVSIEYFELRDRQFRVTEEIDMERKPDTPVRKSRRRYEERNKDERKEKNKVWGTSIERKMADEIDKFLEKYNLTKVELIYAGYETLREQFGPQKQQNKE